MYICFLLLNFNTIRAVLFIFGCYNCFVNIKNYLKVTAIKGFIIYFSFYPIKKYKFYELILNVKFIVCTIVKSNFGKSKHQAKIAM